MIQETLPGMPAPAPRLAPPGGIAVGPVVIDQLENGAGYLAACSSCHDGFTSSSLGRAAIWAIDHNAGHQAARSALEMHGGTSEGLERLSGPPDGL
jgi:hypothetical protein